MSDEDQTAETLANDTTKEAPVNDGVVDLDAQTEVKEEVKPEAVEDGGEVPPKKPSGAQRAKAREQRLLNENAELQRRLDEASRKAPAEAASESEAKPPREEDFNGDYFAWQRAMTAHEAGKSARDAIRSEFKTKEDSERATQQTKIAQERREAHLERVEDAREIIADFDKTMEGMKGVNVRNEVIEEIMSSDNSALLSYHLAKNPDKLEALNSMSGRELAREMGRLEATVKLPEAKKQTTAPPPLKPVTGGASGAFDPSSASMEEYVAKRRAGWKG